jgi:hypothetical protein
MGKDEDAKGFLDPFRGSKMVVAIYLGISSLKKRLREYGHGGACLFSPTQTRGRLRPDD